MSGLSFFPIFPALLPLSWEAARYDHNVVDWAVKQQFNQSINYRNDPKFSDRQTWANSVVLEEQSDQGLYFLPFCLHRLDSLLYGRATLFKF